MKLLYTFTLLVLCCSLSINAQKVVALHSDTNGVQYFEGETALQDAYVAAVATDTLYLPGGTLAPPTLFDKQLTVFGAGHHPDATTATNRSIISTNVTLGENADGFYLEGVNINGYIALGNGFDISVNNVTVKRCNFIDLYAQGTAETNTSNNNVFIENVMNRLYDCRNMRSSSFFNNIITTYSFNAIYNLYFANNVFNHSDTVGGITPTHTAYNCIFQNNIFLHEGNRVVLGQDNTYEHNIICYTGASLDLGVDPTIVNNYILSRANVLVDQQGGAFSYDDDYNLQPGAATNLGTDGTETGVYGGVYPWKDFSIPTNPHIVSKTISGSSDASGNIQVNITVEAQDN